ncbi:MAG: 50S ribosomal protein L39e [Thermoproteota archaeon]|jgi:ribosomal protein L39E
MTSRKKAILKTRLIAKARRAFGVPAWVILKTNRRVRVSYRRRHWRR